MEDLILPSGNLEQEEENLEVIKRISANCELNVVTDSGMVFWMWMSDLAPKKLSIDLLSMERWDRVQGAPVNEGAAAV